MLSSLVTLPAASSLAAEVGRDLENPEPFAEVDWDAWDCLHSMSHQHQGQTDASCDGFVDMIFSQPLWRV